MVNQRSEKIKLGWMRDYHNPQEPKSSSGSVDEMTGNCHRCGAKLKDHAAQDAHNAKSHSNWGMEKQGVTALRNYYWERANKGIQ